MEFNPIAIVLLMLCFVAAFGAIFALIIIRDWIVELWRRRR